MPLLFFGAVMDEIIIHPLFRIGLMIIFLKLCFWALGASISAVQDLVILSLQGTFLVLCLAFNWLMKLLFSPFKLFIKGCRSFYTNNTKAIKILKVLEASTQNDRLRDSIKDTLDNNPSMIDIARLQNKIIKSHYS